jgi:membrane associated rhomboid family serine protease
MPYATLTIIVLCVLAYVCGLPLDYALWPTDSGKFHWWQLVTHAFMHANALHLVVNMLALLSFGPPLEREWGRPKMLTCYFTATIVGGAITALVSHNPLVGASGAIFGLFAAFVCAHPRKRVISIITPWPMEAYKVLLIVVIFSALASIFGWMASVAHTAHLGGIIVGCLFNVANDEPRH